MSTLATFRTNISAILGLDNSTGGDQTQIDAYVNEAVLEVLKNTKCNVTSATATMTANSSDYTLDTDILEIRDVYVTSGGSDYILERRTVNEIIQLRRLTPAATNPTRFYALAGHNLMMLYPAPGSSDVLTFYYVPYPTALSNSAHTPSNSAYGGVPDENHNVIEWYALWRLADMDDDASSDLGERYRAYYREGLVDMRRHLRDKGGYKLSRIRVNPRRAPTAPSDPSISVAW